MPRVKAAPWASQQYSFGFHNAQKYRAEISALLSIDDTRCFSLQTVLWSDAKILLELASTLAHTENAPAFRSFLTLLLLSYLIVLEYLGLPVKLSALVSQRHGLTERTAAAALKGARIINEFINSSARSAWGLGRVTECYMLYPVPASSIPRMRKARPDSAITRSVLERPLRAEGEPMIGVSYTIPTLIFCMLASCVDSESRPKSRSSDAGDDIEAMKITLEMICSALGYEHAEIEKMGCPLAGFQDKEQTQSSSLHFENHGVRTIYQPRSRHDVANHFVDEEVINTGTYMRLQGSLLDCGQTSNLGGSCWEPRDTDASNCEHLHQRPVFANMIASLHFISLWEHGCDTRVFAVMNQPQDIWNAQGALLPMTWEEKFGKHFRAVDFSRDFLALVDLCNRCGWIDTIYCDGNTVYSVNFEGRCELEAHDIPSSIVLQSVAMTAYLVPVDHDLSTIFVERGRVMLPALKSLLLSPSVRHILTTTTNNEIATLVTECRKSLIEASLTVFRLFSNPTNGPILAHIEFLMRYHPPDYLSIALSWKKSQMLRSRGQSELSETEAVLGHEMTKSMSGYSDLRVNYYGKRLLLSQADNRIIRKRFEEARSLLQQCTVRPDPDGGLSPLELQLLRVYNTTDGRISQYEGKFDRALRCYKASRIAYLSEASQRHMYSHVADIMCELGEEDAAQCELESRFDINSMMDDDRTLDNRRILLPLAEVYLKRGRISDAQRAIKTAMKIFHRLERPNITDQLGHIRAKFGQIRIHVQRDLWLSAAHEIDSAISMAHGFNAFSATNYYIGLLWKYRCIVDRKLKQSAQELGVCRTLHGFDPGPRHFIPGLGTYVRADIDRLAQSCGPHFNCGN